MANEIHAKREAFLKGKPPLQRNQLFAATQAISEDTNRPFGYITNLNSTLPHRPKIDSQDMAQGKKLAELFLNKNPELKDIAAKYEAAETLKTQLLQVNNQDELAEMKTNAQETLAIIATPKDTAGLGILASIKSLFNRLGLSFSAKKEESRVNVKREPLFRPHEDFIPSITEQRELMGRSPPSPSSPPKPGQR